ncbi:Branchpoint-bridging protein [Kluyveromyces marxianus]|nr:Branchpoint-bridging protein [Kluyveromyces marxianus]KAG0682843.1 Branchpoint-bridging protein [Kluyveromyces marxianus]
MWGDDSSSENTGGLFKWTVDALFRRDASPSVKYKDNDRGTYVDSAKVRSRPRERSSSFSDLDIYSKFELLPDEEDPELLRPVSTNGLFDEKQNTNTFHTRRNRRDRPVGDTPSIRRAPNPDDPVISALFGEAPTRGTAAPAAPAAPAATDYLPGRTDRDEFLPGKFPSPTRPMNNRQTGREDEFAPQAQRVHDYTPEYVSILDKLSLNSKALRDLKLDVQQKQKYGMERETELKDKYLQIRQELIQELKQSKMIYDNYCKLYFKYKELKKRPLMPNQPLVSNTSMLEKIRSLESKVVDLSIENDRLEKEAEQQRLSFELKQQELQNKFEVERLVYERRIQELQDKVHEMSTGIAVGTDIGTGTGASNNNNDNSFYRNHLHTSSTTATTATPLSDSTASPYKEYNNTIDTQFLRNLVK